MKKITSTHDIPEGASLRTYLPGFGYSILRVIDITDQFIGALAEDDFYQAASDGATLQCYYGTEYEKSYEFSLKIIGRLTRGKKILFLQHSKEILRNNMRKCLSAEVTLPFRHFLFNSDNDKKNENLLFHEGVITSLSDRDITFTSTAPAKNMTFVFGHLDIPGHRLELVGKITSTAPGPSLRASLKGMNEKERELLLNYIFSIYRE